jgi:hypothetical protein
MVSVRKIRAGYVVLEPERMFGSSKPVGQWARSVARRLDQAVTAEAPSRSGNLKASIGSSVRRSGPLRVTLSLRLPGYAEFVDQGTDTYAQGHRDERGRIHGGQAIGRQSLYGPVTMVTERRGQTAQHFIARGAARVARKHTSIASAFWNDPWGGATTSLR